MPRTLTAVELAYEAGRWVPGYYGLRFRTVRQLPARQRTMHRGEEYGPVVTTLAEAVAECDRLNRKTK